jgi:putative MFS transporter
MNDLNLLNRFDTARFGRFHVTLMLLTGSCWIWAAYGVGIIGFLLPALKNEWGVSASALSYLAVIGMLGMLTGSVIAGRMSDRFGRRRMLTLIMLFLGLSFVFSGIVGNYPGLLVLRFMTGMGMGAILPAAGALVTEFSPMRHRGTMLVLLNGFWGIGTTLAALIGYFLVLPYGWRPSMLFGGLAILTGLLIHHLLPESLRYLLDKKHYDRAQTEAARVHIDVDELTADRVENPVPASVNSQPDRSGIWSRRYARTTGALWYLWFALNFVFQGVFIWLPTLLASVNSSNDRSFLLTLFISLGQMPGALIIAYLADKASRRKLLIISLGLLGSATFVFGFSEATTWVLILGFLLMVFNGMAWGLAHPYTSELYPTRMRGSAAGWAMGVGRLGGVAAPLIIGLIIQASGGIPFIFTILATAPILAMVTLAGVKTETTGRSLEEITSE